MTNTENTSHQSVWMYEILVICYSLLLRRRDVVIVVKSADNRVKPKHLSCLCGLVHTAKKAIAIIQT